MQIYGVVPPKKATFGDTITSVTHMTAIVGILNKQAIAIAADSAVTIDGPNGTKIYNHANKIFTLSKHHPVAVMLYNSAEFMGVPWETIIKLYRKRIGDCSFPTVAAYQEDFIAFLREKRFFTDEAGEMAVLENFVQRSLLTLLHDALANREDLQVGELSGEQVAEAQTLIDLKIQEIMPGWQNEELLLPEVLATPEEDCEGLRAKLYDVTQRVLATSPLAPLKALLDDWLFHVLCRKEDTMSDFTGLVFVGYGDEEIFPVISAMNISFSINGILRYFIDDAHSAAIAHDTPGAIIPLAQEDVMKTILTGIAPDIQEIVEKITQDFLLEYHKRIADNLFPVAPQLAGMIERIPTTDLLDNLILKVEEAKSKLHIAPLLDSVSMLSKEDLAEMAESLIYLTYLKRRITFAQESVGGPVDVALISKGDGFVWIKRKQYFKPELNQPFIQNYLTR